MPKEPKEKEVAKFCPIEDLPLDTKWIIKMLTILPRGSRGKLEKFVWCDPVRKGLEAKARELGVTLKELGFGELEGSSES